MPATRPVSLGWQFIFAFIPILNVWAFYRIRRLRKYFLLVIVPQFAILAAIGMSTSNMVLVRFVHPPLGLVWPDPNLKLSSEGDFDAAVLGVALQVLTLYLVIKWSREHNRQFDVPETPMMP